MKCWTQKSQFNTLTGIAPKDRYTRRLARGWTIGMAQELKQLQGLIRLSHPMLVRQLQHRWLRTEPDLVVSLVPNFNKAMYEALAHALPGVPYVTVLTDLVLFGGHGSKTMLGIARRLPGNTQLILLYGHNQALARRLRALPGNAPRVVVGFITNIPRYMQLADFFIGKPVPGSLSEAVQKGRQ